MPDSTRKQDGKQAGGQTAPSKEPPGSPEPWFQPESGSPAADPPAPQGRPISEDD
jgi:hypothetical protein